MARRFGALLSPPTWPGSSDTDDHEGAHDRAWLAAFFVDEPAWYGKVAAWTREAASRVYTGGDLLHDQRMNSLDPDSRRAADLERCDALVAEYEELARRSASNDADPAKEIEILEQLDELIYLGRIPKRADQGLSRFNLPRLYSSAGSWERYLAWMHRQLQQESSPRDKAKLLCGMAHCAEQNLGDRPRAASFLREALELDPALDRARERLRLLE